GLDMGIPLDKLRQLSLVVGPRIVLSVDENNTFALLAGMRAGLRYKTAGLGGFTGTLFSESGGIGFPDLSSGKFGSAPYEEVGASLGFHYAGMGINLEGATGVRSSIIPEIDGSSGIDNIENSDYFRLGLVFSFTK
ncbi:MAG: hypothetical protein WBB36_05975, partial [Chitinophagales bacterium]